MENHKDLLLEYLLVENWKQLFERRFVFADEVLLTALELLAKERTIKDGFDDLLDYIFDPKRKEAIVSLWAFRHGQRASDVVRTVFQKALQNDLDPTHEKFGVYEAGLRELRTSGLLIHYSEQLKLYGEFKALRKKVGIDEMRVLDEV